MRGIKKEKPLSSDGGEGTLEIRLRGGYAITMTGPPEELRTTRDSLLNARDHARRAAFHDDYHIAGPNTEEIFDPLDIYSISIQCKGFNEEN